MVEVEVCRTHKPLDSNANQTTCTKCGQPIAYVHVPKMNNMGHWVTIDEKTARG